VNCIVRIDRRRHSLIIVAYTRAYARAHAPNAACTDVLSLAERSMHARAPARARARAHDDARSTIESNNGETGLRKCRGWKLKRETTRGAQRGRANPRSGSVDEKDRAPLKNVLLIVGNERFVKPGCISPSLKISRTRFEWDTHGVTSSYILESIFRR